MKKSLIVFLFAAALSVSAFAQQALIPNNSSTGTQCNKLAKLTGIPSAAILTATTDTSGIVGPVVAGCSTSGNAIIATSGVAPLTFDGSTTAGDYIEQSTAIAGAGHDAGASCPASGQVVGRLLSTNAGAGTYAILVGAAGCFGSGGGGTTFASILGGINTNALQMGTGGTLGYTGSGIVNANYLLGSPLAALPGSTQNLCWTGSAFSWCPGGTGTVTSLTIAPTANQISVAGTCTITSTGTCTLSLPSTVDVTNLNVATAFGLYGATIPALPGSLLYLGYTGSAFTWGNPSGAGTVTSFSATPTVGTFLTTIVTNPTSIPALTISLSNAPAYSLWGNNTASSATPGYSYTVGASANNIPQIGSGGLLLQSIGGTGLNTSAATGILQYASGVPSVSTALANGTTATTQPCSDTSSLLATDDYVQCFANAAANGSILAKLYVNPIRGGYVADASTTSGSSTVTCPNLDCNFVAGNVGDLVWVQTNLTNLVTATYICPQSTIATVNSANSITLTTSADCTSTTTGTATLVWGPDDSGTYGSNSDALDAAFTATGANGALCGSLALSAGIYLIQHAEFNYLPSGCSAISSYQAPTIFGVNSTATQIIPTPNFSFTGGSHGGCGSIGTSSCLFGAQYQYVQGLKIFGMGAGTGTHNVSLTQNYGTIFYDVVLDGWCANCAGSVGYYQQFSQSEGLVGGSVFFGATNCQDVGVLNKLDNWPCYGGVNTGLLVSAGSTISQENYFGGNTYEIVVDAGATLFSNVDTDFNFPPNSYEILNEGTINFNGFQRANSTANPIFGFSGTAVTTFQNSKLYGPTSGSWKNAFYAGILGSTMLDQGGNTWNGAQAVPYIATLTNSSDNVSCGSGTTCAKAFVSNTAANSVLLAGCESYTGTVTTPTDTLSLTWISLGNVATGSTYAASISTAMYYAENTAGGADTVTCHYSSSSGGAVEIAEIDNAYIASPIDSGNTTSSGSGTAISSHAPTTTFNSDDSFLVVMRNGTPSFTSGTCTPASNCIVIPGWFGGTSAQNGVGIAPISPVMTGTLSVNADWVAYWFNIRPYGVAPAIFGNAQAAASVGGTAQAQTITLSQPPPGLYPNLAITYLPTNSNNAAAPTIAVNGFTATPVTKCGTTALIAGDIAANVFASVRYDGVEFQLGNPQAAGCGLGSGTQTIASGTAALGTSAIASGACASVVTVSAPGVLTTDVVTVGANQNISGITGYVPSTSGTLTIWPPWPTANNVNILVCNQTSSSITPGALTLNYRVVR